MPDISLKLEAGQAYEELKKLLAPTEAWKNSLEKLVATLEKTGKIPVLGKILEDLEEARKKTVEVSEAGAKVTLKTGRVTGKVLIPSEEKLAEIKEIAYDTVVQTIEASAKKAFKI